MQALSAEVDVAPVQRDGFADPEPGVNEECEEEPPLVREGIQEGAQLVLGQSFRPGFGLVTVDPLCDAKAGGGIGAGVLVLVRRRSWENDSCMGASTSYAGPGAFPRRRGISNVA